MGERLHQEFGATQYYSRPGGLRDDLQARSLPPLKKLELLQQSLIEKIKRRNKGVKNKEPSRVLQPTGSNGAFFSHQQRAVTIDAKRSSDRVTPADSQNLIS